MEKIREENSRKQDELTAQESRRKKAKLSNAAKLKDLKKDHAKVSKKATKLEKEVAKLREEKKSLTKLEKEVTKLREENKNLKKMNADLKKQVKKK